MWNRRLAYDNISCLFTAFLLSYPRCNAQVYDYSECVLLFKIENLTNTTGLLCVRVLKLICAIKFYISCSSPGLSRVKYRITQWHWDATLSWVYVKGWGASTLYCSVFNLSRVPLGYCNMSIGNILPKSLTNHIHINCRSNPLPYLAKMPNLRLILKSLFCKTTIATTATIAMATIKADVVNWQAWEFSTFDRSVAAFCFSTSVDLSLFSS